MLQALAWVTLTVPAALFAILRAFRAEGIEVPFPRRDVRMLSAGGADKLPPAGAAG